MIFPIYLIRIIVHIFCGGKPEHLEETRRHEETRLIHTDESGPDQNRATWHQCQPLVNFFKIFGWDKPEHLEKTHIHEENTQTPLDQNLAAVPDQMVFLKRDKKN